MSRYHPARRRAKPRGFDLDHFIENQLFPLCGGAVVLTFIGIAIWLAIQV